MRSILFRCSAFLVLALFSSVYSATLSLERGSDLQSVINFASDGDTLLLSAKSFTAKGSPFKDILCGNCSSPTEPVEASYGFIIKGKKLIIIGEDREKTQLITSAGYGVYYENSNGSELRNLTISGGVRDDDGNATDAGVVVRNSVVSIVNVSIINNTDRSDDTSVVVGIGGIFGREGADIDIVGCNIINNGWDGIALYRGATARVVDCIIKDGRGAGIGVTWDATCIAYRNRISGFWKGIGAFGTSQVIARNNLVYNNLGWGMIATGQSYLDACNNVIYHNGNCGIAPWSTESRGRFINNIIAENGWRKQWVCPCVGVWNYGDWAKWIFRNNIVWSNKEGEYQDIWDQSGINGNLNIDPGFTSDSTFTLSIGSPARNAGDSTIYNIDGSRSHIGLSGGPQARDY